jgi:alkenylglycerophosphocholine/alkenylglycerophosphoethanolamine hydrolase
MIIFTVIVLLFIVLSVIGIIHAANDSPNYTVIKPLPILLLIISVIFFIRSDINTTMLIAIGLILGMIGDILLTKDEFFLQGLISFLFGHIMYVIYFFLNINTIVFLVMLFFVVAAIYAYNFYKRLPEKNKNMAAPIGAYMVVITLMVISAVTMYINSGGLNYLFVVGALLFFISDSILAWHLMIKPVKNDALLVMGTYYSAQFFIAAGVMAPLVF